MVGAEVVSAAAAGALTSPVVRVSFAAVAAAGVVVEVEAGEEADAVLALAADSAAPGVAPAAAAPGAVPAAAGAVVVFPCRDSGLIPMNWYHA